MNDLTLEIESIFGTGANFTYTEEEREYLLRIIQSKFYKNIGRLLICVENSVKVGIGAQRLGREIRKYFNPDKILNPDYIKHLENTWNQYKNFHINNPFVDNPFKQKLYKEIASIKHYAGTLQESPLGYQGALRTWVSRFSKNLDDFGHDYFADIAVKKMKNRALLTSRTELGRAYSSTFVSSGKESPMVIGFRWNLSATHKLSCICEQYAGRVFDKNKPLPKCGAHPACKCYWTEVLKTLEQRAKDLQVVVNV